MNQEIKELISEMMSTHIRIEDCQEQLEKRIEQDVAGKNAIIYRTVERLLGTSASAIEEAITWLGEMK